MIKGQKSLMPLYTQCFAWPVADKVRILHSSTRDVVLEKPAVTNSDQIFIATMTIIYRRFAAKCRGVYDELQ